jgi:hypothetical protein
VEKKSEIKRGRDEITKWRKMRSRMGKGKGKNARENRRMGKKEH